MEGIMNIIIGIVIALLGGGAILTIRNNKDKSKQKFRKKVDDLIVERDDIHEQAKVERQRIRDEIAEQSDDELARRFRDRVKRERDSNN